MSLEKEAKDYMEKRKNTFPKKIEDIIENLKLVENLVSITLKKLKELSAKNNSNS